MSQLTRCEQVLRARLELVPVLPQNGNLIFTWNSQLSLTPARLARGDRRCESGQFRMDCEAAGDHGKWPAAHTATPANGTAGSGNRVKGSRTERAPSTGQVTPAQNDARCDLCVNRMRSYLVKPFEFLKSWLVVYVRLVLGYVAYTYCG